MIKEPSDQTEDTSNKQMERFAYYVVAVPYYGREDNAPDKVVAQAVYLSVGSNAEVFKTNYDGYAGGHQDKIEYEP